jgi:hypothetical protein
MSSSVKENRTPTISGVVYMDGQTYEYVVLVAHQMMSRVGRDMHSRSCLRDAFGLLMTLTMPGTHVLPLRCGCSVKIDVYGQGLHAGKTSVSI